MNKPFIGKIVASICLFILSIIFISVGSSRINGSVESGQHSTQTSTISAGLTYNISSNKSYIIGSSNYTTMKITVYGTSKTFENVPVLYKNGTKISYKGYSSSTSSVTYTYNVSAYSTYTIEFTTVINNSDSKFKVVFS